MTTVAWDGISLAGDSLIEHDGVVCSVPAKKVRRLNDGRVVGVAGVWAVVPELLAFLEGERPWSPRMAGVQAIVVDGHQAVVHEGAEIPYAVSAPTCIGSGGTLAEAAIRSGLDARRAVRIAAEMDIRTGGRVIAIRCVPKA